jgi:predicted O-methyltransferase YrrM
MKEISKSEYMKPIREKARAFDSFLRSRGIIGGAGFMHPCIYALIYALVRSLKPSIVVETGVAGGMSSCYILKGLRDNNKGELFSIDLPCELNHATSVSSPIPVGAKPG